MYPEEIQEIELSEKLSAAMSAVHSFQARVRRARDTIKSIDASVARLATEADTPELRAEVLRQLDNRRFCEALVQHEDAGVFLLRKEEISIEAELTKARRNRRRRRELLADVERYRADRRSRTPSFLEEIRDRFVHLDGDADGFEASGLIEIE